MDIEKIQDRADGIEERWIDAPSESITIRGTVGAAAQPGMTNFSYENDMCFDEKSSWSDIMKHLTGHYECHEVRPGVYEHVFTPGTVATAAPFFTYIDDKTVAITYHGSIPVFVQRSRKGYKAKLRARRKCRAAFRRRKRGLA